MNATQYLGAGEISYWFSHRSGQCWFRYLKQLNINSVKNNNNCFKVGSTTFKSPSSIESKKKSYVRFVFFVNKNFFGLCETGTVLDVNIIIVYITLLKIIRFLNLQVPTVIMCELSNGWNFCWYVFKYTSCYSFRFCEQVRCDPVNLLFT